MLALRMPRCMAMSSNSGPLFAIPLGFTRGNCLFCSFGPLRLRHSRCRFLAARASADFAAPRAVLSEKLKHVFRELHLCHSSNHNAAGAGLLSNKGC